MKSETMILLEQSTIFILSAAAMMILIIAVCLIVFRKIFMNINQYKDLEIPDLKGKLSARIVRDTNNNDNNVATFLVISRPGYTHPYLYIPPRFSDATLEHICSIINRDREESDNE